jgi:hypothetical protein
MPRICTPFLFRSACARCGIGIWEPVREMEGVTVLQGILIAGRSTYEGRAAVSTAIQGNRESSLSHPADDRKQDPHPDHAHREIT